MANSLLNQVKFQLQSPMAELEELGYEAEFTDSAIYYALADALDDYNFEFEATNTSSLTIDGDDKATDISISPALTAERTRVLALQAAYLLIEEWVNLNLMNGELGVSVRDGLATISTMGRATHSNNALKRMAQKVRRMVNRIKIRLAAKDALVVSIDNQT